MTSRYFGILFFLILTIKINSQNNSKAPIKSGPFLLPEYEIIIPTFLGNNYRNYYGNEAPDTLITHWKLFLGSGKTVISRKLGEREWAGAGWTGQPLLVREDTNLFLIQGAYDHNLKKIDANTGKLIWQYKFDDVIKGTGTLWENPDTSEPENKIVILQGSRLGVGNFLDSEHIPSYRAISYFTGKELWRLDSKWTDSYSRDVDGSALIYKDTAYIGFENSLFTKFSPDYKDAILKDDMLQPAIYKETCLYTKDDVVHHKNNVVTESSPSLIDSVFYIASGSGHIFGYSLREDTITWDFYIGSDIDGSAVITHDSCIIVTIEKQYIDGPGGVLKLDPKKKPEDAVVWFFPTESIEYSGWEGGVIGTAGINDYYNNGHVPYMAAFSAIDGNLYVVDHMQIDTSLWVDGFDLKHKYHPPKLIYKHKIGASISSPIFVGNKIIAAGYGGLFLFRHDNSLKFTEVASHEGSYESSPIVYNRIIYVASRDGYFYCLGE
jgi:outer membrane protein assembly factor BamB